MQTLNDGTQVTSRSYYYLLDWNDWNDWKFIRKEFNKDSLRDLTILEYQTLFHIATSQEFPIEPNQPTIIMYGSGITTAKDYEQLIMKVRGLNNVSPWEESAYFSGKLLEEPPLIETLIDPFVQSKPRKKIRMAAHLSPNLTVSELSIIEPTPKISLQEAFKRKSYELFTQENYVYNPKRKKSSRVRGEKNKEFKQSIRNLTNNQKK